MLPRLSLDFSFVWSTFINRSSDLSISWYQDVSCAGLECACDHILDEIPVVGSIAGDVIPLVCEQLLILSHLGKFSHMIFAHLSLSSWATIG